MMNQYYVTVWEKWEHGTKWSQVIGTNDVEALRESLKAKYERFKIVLLGD